MDKDSGLYGDKIDAFLNSIYDDGNFSFNQPKLQSATLNDIAEKIETGEIKFSENAEIVLLGCTTADHPVKIFDSFAENFSEVVKGSYVVGATGKVEPNNILKNGKPYRESGTYKSETKQWKTFRDGELIKSLETERFNPKKFDPKK